MKDFPKWAELTPEKATADLPCLLAEAEKSVAEIEAANPSTYEDLVWRLDDATRALWRLWGGAYHMLSVVNSPAWRDFIASKQPEVVAFSLRVGQSKPIYDACRRIETADPLRRRILDKMIEGAFLSGVGLEGEAKDRFNAIQSRLAELGNDFSNAVVDATKAYKFEKDGKTYTIDDASYPETMKHCADREVREALCVARSKRAPENTARIVEILSLRQELASILGFASYAEYSLKTKCAPGLAAVNAMVEELDRATGAFAKSEDAELDDIAAEYGISKVEPWDRSFLAERLREKKYSYSEEELKRHFEFADVLAGLFRMAKFLFDIDVEEVAPGEKPQVWHKDVRVFRVLEKGATVSHFYLDPYVRPGEKNGGAWMNEFRNRNDRDGSTPLAVLVLNLKVPDENGKTYMPFREVETLFHEFGHALQQMLTRVAEEDAAGINLVEWDAVEVASQFMENWCLDNRTGIEVPADLKARVKAAKNFRAASACRRQLGLAKTDLLIHEGPVSDADAVKREVFSHFGNPMVEGDIFLNGFTHIFSGGYAAGYYGYKWSEVMSADCYGAFEEAGLEDDVAVKSVGAKYRETILAMGGSKSAYDVFVEFRGRKPNSAALLRQQGLSGGAV